MLALVPLLRVQSLKPARVPTLPPRLPLVPALWYRSRNQRPRGTHRDSQALICLFRTNGSMVRLMELLQTRNSKQISDQLIARYGVQDAYTMALLASADVQMLGDNYALSVWREVKQTLLSRLAEARETV